MLRAFAVLLLAGLSAAQVLPESTLIRLKEQGINPYATPPQPGVFPLNLPESDCPGAIRVCTNTYSYPGGIPTPGQILELDNTGRGTCLLGGEHRSVWFIFTVQTGGTLGFLLCPNAATNNDYDFALWDVTGLTNPCSIFQGTGNVPAPIRCNFSVPNQSLCCGGIVCGNNGLTGLDHTNTQPGSLSYGASGPAVMPGLTVTAGQTFLLLVDNWSDNNVGFTITFYGTAQYFDATPPELDSAYRVCSPDYDTQLPALTRLRVRFDELINPNSVTADGSDFTVVHNATNTAVPITAAAPLNPPQTNTVELTLGQPLLPGQTYTVYVGYNPPGSGSNNGQPGSDGNTIADQCGIYVSTTNVAPGSGSSSYTFTVVDTLNIQVTLVSPRCVGTPTGEIRAQVSGGLSPYEYVLLSGSGTIPPTTGWSPVSVWAGRTAGTYTVWVRDRMGCIQRRVVQLIDPTPVSVIVEDSLLSACGGLPTGFVRLNGSGGTPPYEFSVLPIAPTWQGSGYFGGLGTGTYTLRVRDANGCIATRTISVQIAPAVSLQLVSVDTVRCYGETGGFTVQATGGSGSGFTYSLSTGQTSPTGIFTGLPAGTYQVLAVDGAGCKDSLQVTLTQPDSLHLTGVSISPSLCLRTAQGAITVTATGGNPPYTFLWRDSIGTPLSSTAETLSDIPTGAYSVVVTDRKGCTYGPVSYTVPYTYHAEIRGFSYEVVEDCPKKRLRYTVETAGVSPLSYIWTWEDGSQETTSAPTIEREYNPLQGGTLPVQVEVLSGGQCAVDTLVQVPFTACAGLLIPSVLTPNGDGINDLWEIQALGFQRYTVVVYNRWGQEVWSNNGDLSKQWDGRDKRGQPLLEGAYVYYFTGVDNNGRTVQRTGTVTLLR